MKETVTLKLSLKEKRETSWLQIEKAEDSLMKFICSSQ